MEQSYLRFSLEESIWFKRGQEVGEFLSVSLDPVISVDEYEHYITIRGALELSGEYRMADDDGEEADLYDFSTRRFVQRITTREDGVSELFHRFPVDITIPKNRIFSLDDVYVTVESFDYDLGSDGRLSLVADISISGILEEEAEEASSWFEPFEAIARKEWYEQEETEEVEQTAVLEEENVARATGERSETNELVEEAVHEAKERSETSGLVEEIVHEQEAKVSIGTSPKQADEPAEENKKPRKENALYLTSLFKEQGEDFSRVKICIVQQGDSMDKIAKRYDISIQQLLRANHLEHETDLSEGQLLYIPIPANQRA
ncbi:stage VI sporulation protein D [Anoxybacillus voinovskiensis]|uniref:Stage VI sporulation protein D n=1 Tax=Anoxybacteroides voinovskiense TaxID=230470 RepID=A0A840DVU4_9BACL|nr:stage VI sporulation protein D [Anoxybacillus voinovskiensis]MBB4073206.1 stage VI sporulation protein D [Anoxybacillus voinovskiensis]GGJ67683.1 stage VI sporulation protein D [Anoxybacillus voinovskiensis]